MARRKIDRYKSYAGYRYHRKNPYTGDYNVLYDTKKTTSFDPAGGRYVDVCEKHGTLCNFRTLTNARAHLPHADWCEPCMRIKERKKKRGK